MPRPLSWLPRLPEIRRSVSNSVRTHYDRPAFEQLFQMQPRAAGKLMAVMPQVEALGKSRLVERGELLKFLEEVYAAEDVANVYAQRRETQRKISRRKPRVLFRRDLIDDGTLVALPSTVVLERGRLEVRFGSLVELVEALAVVAGSLSNDEEAFEAAYVPEGSAPARERAAAEREDVRRLLDDLRARETMLPASPGQASSV